MKSNKKDIIFILVFFIFVSWIVWIITKVKCIEYKTEIKKMGGYWNTGAFRQPFWIPEYEVKETYCIKYGI